VPSHTHRRVSVAPTVLKLLKLRRGEPHSNFSFKFNSRLYTPGITLTLDDFKRVFAKPGVVAGGTTLLQFSASIDLFMGTVQIFAWFAAFSS
jgi:hypothetical protein